MKTIKDLEEMKLKAIVPFGTQYNYFLANLEDYYIAKLNGIDRIKDELSKWDSEAQKVIINELIKMISNSGIIGFNESELLSLAN